MLGKEGKMEIDKKGCFARGRGKAKLTNSDFYQKKIFIFFNLNFIYNLIFIGGVAYAR